MALILFSLGIVTLPDADAQVNHLFSGTSSPKLRGSLLSSLASAHWAMDNKTKAMDYMRQVPDLIFYILNLKRQKYAIVLI